MQDTSDKDSRNGEAETWAPIHQPEERKDETLNRIFTFCRGECM
jgi:hypothetical protein